MPLNDAYYWLNGVRRGEHDNNSDSDPTAVSSPFRRAAALADPNSDRSNALYFGGGAGAAEADINRARAASYAAQNRVGPQMDQGQMQGSRGQLVGLGNQLTGLAAGDPNSQAQQQLQRGYGAANGAMMSGAASARGGGIAGALAQRGAANGMAANSQNQAIASDALMQQERMNALGNLGALGGAMRATDSSAAFGQAGLDAEQRARNDAMTAEYERQQQAIAAMGMQGQQNRMGQRAQVLQTAYGQATAEGAAQRARDAEATNTALGAASSGASAAGSIWNQMQDDQRKRMAGG